MKEKKYLGISVIISVICLIIYLPRLSPTVFGADSGDFLAAILSKGVAHPPGYPLYLLLGRLFNTIPVGFSLAYKVGLISSISTALAVGTMFYLTIRLTRQLLPSVISAISFAFIYSVWVYAEVVEAFSLGLLFISLILLFSYLAYTDLLKKKKAGIFYFLLCFLLGLSLSHHHLVLLLIFPLGYLFWPFRKIILQGKFVILGLFLFIFGLIPYISTYLSAKEIPFVNWDNPVNFTNWWRLFSRADYGTFTLVSRLSSQGLLMRIFQIWPFTYLLYLDFTFLGLALSLFGLIKSKKQFGRYYFFLIIGFLILGPFFMFYAAPSISSIYSFGIIERFVLFTSPFLIPFLSFGIYRFTFFIAGAFRSVEFTQKKKAIFMLLMQLLFLLLPLSLYLRNNKRADFSQFNLGDELGRLIYTSVADNQKAILYLSGDDDIFTTWYYVLNKYKIPPSNIALISSDMLNQKGMDIVIKKYYPWAYFKELSEPKSANELFGLYLKKYIGKVPMYVSEDTYLPKNYKLIPRKAVFQVLKTDQKINVEKEISYYRKIKKELDPAEYLSSPLSENFFVRDLITNYGNLHANYAKFFIDQKKYAEAKQAIFYVNKYAPEATELYYLLGLILKQEKKCKEAEMNFLIYFQAKPDLETPLNELIDVSKNCLKNKSKQKLYENMKKELILSKQKPLKLL